VQHHPISRELRRNTDTQGYIFHDTPDLSVHGQQALDSMAGFLNSRPRRTLGWDSPYQAFAQLMQAIGQREAATIPRFSISGAAHRI
jgi:IS30 family transposase